MISMLYGSISCVGNSLRWVCIAESLESLACSLMRCIRILFVVPIYDCLHVSHVILYTTIECACFSLMLSLKGNILPISLGALNATLSSTSKVSLTSFVSLSAKASTLLLLYGRTMYFFVFSTVYVH